MNTAVLSLIAEMRTKALIAEANGDRLTAELCAITLQNVLPMVGAEQPKTLIPGSAQAALINAWGKHLAA